MKNLKLTFIYMFSFLLTGMISCTKTEDIQPSGTIDRQLATTKESFTVGMIMTGPEVLVGESAYFEPFIFLNNGGEYGVSCGKLCLQKLNAKTQKWEDVKGAQYLNVYNALYIINQVSFADEGYYRWHYISTNNCSFKSSFGGSLYLDVVNEYTEEGF